MAETSFEERLRLTTGDGLRKYGVWYVRDFEMASIPEQLREHGYYVSEPIIWSNHTAVIWAVSQPELNNAIYLYGRGTGGVPTLAGGRLVTAEPSLLELRFKAAEAVKPEEIAVAMEELKTKVSEVAIAVREVEELAKQTSAAATVGDPVKTQELAEQVQTASQVAIHKAVETQEIAKAEGLPAVEEAAIEVQNAVAIVEEKAQATETAAFVQEIPEVQAKAAKTVVAAKVAVSAANKVQAATSGFPTWLIVVGIAILIIMGLSTKK